MTLLEEAMEPCVIMDKTTQPDGYGGVVTVWVDGAPVNAAIAAEGGVEQLIAQQRGWNGSYRVTTRKNVVFLAGDVIRRLSDGKYFRIKSDGTDKKTPASATLDMRVVKAEDYTMAT